MGFGVLGLGFGVQVRVWYMILSSGVVCNHLCQSCWLLSLSYSVETLKAPGPKPWLPWD